MKNMMARFLLLMAYANPASAAPTDIVKCLELGKSFGIARPIVLDLCTSAASSFPITCYKQVKDGLINRSTGRQIEFTDAQAQALCKSALDRGPIECATRAAAVELEAAPDAPGITFLTPAEISQVCYWVAL